MDDSFVVYRKDRESVHNIPHLNSSKLFGSNARAEDDSQNIICCLLRFQLWRIQHLGGFDVHIFSKQVTR